MEAYRWTGENSQEICAAVTGLDLKPYELGGGVSLRQRGGAFFLTLPAREGEVWLSEGDYAVKESDGEWVRLSPDQMAEEYPDCTD